jgi:hypothetical protein
MSDKTKRYHVYTTQGTVRNREFVSAHDEFSDAREAALDLVHGRGVPVVVIDTTDAQGVYPYAPLVLGVPYGGPGHADA